MSGVSGRSRAARSTPGRNLVLCFDGTSQSYDGGSLSNIPLLFGLLGCETSRQLLYYQSGIGCYTPLATPVGPFVATSRLLDKAIAWSVDEHVREGYRFLMDRYADGDRIFLFGFSRGAFVARALAGFLDCCGLLFQGNDESVTLAWHIYADMTEDKRPDGEQVAAGFQRTFSRSVPIHFLGVFDTVASVGSLIPRTLPFSQGAQTISTFRHALALDERRVRFAPQLWMKPRRDYALRQMQRKAEMRHTDKISRAYSEPELSTHDELDRVTLPNGEVVGTRDVKEVFFAGGHSDVGGGATLSDAPPKLSHIPLRWLVREAVRKGLVVDETVLVSSQLYRAFVEEARKLVGPTGTATNFREFFDGDTHGDKPNEFVCALIETASRPTVPVTPDNVDAFLSSPSQVDSPFVRDALAPQHDRLAFSGTSNQGMWHALKHKLLSLVYWTLELGPNLSFVWTPTGEVRKALIVANMGRPRSFDRRSPSTRSPTLHTSVLIRQRAPAWMLSGGDGENVKLSAKEQGYEPLAIFSEQSHVQYED